MAIKHKVLKDFQLITEDKKIIIIKAKTIVENYKFKNKNDLVSVPIDVIKNNTDYFAQFDWKEELQTFLRTNKIPQPAVITKKIVPFIESLMEQNEGSNKEVIIEKEVIKEVIVEKPKIVEKEIVVEKPKIIEKEVIVEKLVTDDSVSIELENKINKIKLKEEQLDRELNAVNLRELSVENKEKELNEKISFNNDKEAQLSQKELELNNKETELTAKQNSILEKENSLSDYISRNLLNERVETLKRQGFVTDLYERLINGN